MALRAAIYLSLLGPRGLEEVATLCHSNAKLAAEQLRVIPGCEVNCGDSTEFFKEFVLKLPMRSRDLVDFGIERGINPGVPLEAFFPERTHELLVACTEKTTRKQISDLAELVADATKSGVSA